MELLIALIGIGITIIMVLILLSGFMQDMNWYDNQASFDVIKANREDAKVKPVIPSKRKTVFFATVCNKEFLNTDSRDRRFCSISAKQSVTPVKKLIKWMDYHEINQ